MTFSYLIVPYLGLLASCLILLFIKILDYLLNSFSGFRAGKYVAELVVGALCEKQTFI